MERYAPEFRQDAVSLVLSSGRPIKQIAQELGIHDTTLGTHDIAIAKLLAPIQQLRASP